MKHLRMLCGHALKILDVMDVKETIPSNYIMKRWTKDTTVMTPIDINKDKEDVPVASSTHAENAQEGSNGVEVFVDSANVAKVMGLKRKEPIYRVNTRPKSFLEKTSKRKKKPLSTPAAQFRVSHLVNNCTNSYTHFPPPVNYNSLVKLSIYYL
ncbi:unnamed protein product [Ilex paraguariensis]|uniref:Protein FAR1-RELATED SEQUENCE n=1 Tax=Ilex paraguariensis TaxID=185542 RepID=A0ABC8SVT9_9AQUA